MMTDSNELCNNQKHIQINSLKIDTHGGAAPLFGQVTKEVVHSAPEEIRHHLSERRGRNDDPSDPPISGEVPSQWSCRGHVEMCV